MGGFNNPFDLFEQVALSTRPSHLTDSHCRPAS